MTARRILRDAAFVACLVAWWTALSCLPSINT